MKKYFSIALVLALFVFSFGRLALAEETSAGASSDTTVKTETKKPAGMRAEVEAKIKAQQEAIRKEIEAKKNALMNGRDALKADLETKRNAIKTEVELKKDAIKADLEAKKAGLKENRDALKQELTGERQNFEARKEAFKKELETKKQEFQAGLKADREVFKTKLEAEKAAFKTNIKEKRGEFRAKAKEVLSQRFEAAIKALSNTQTRVASVIAKFKAEGADTTQAEVYLADSKQKLADAQAKLAEIKALIPTTDESVTAETFEKIKTGANDVKNLLKESKDSLANAVKALKALRPAAKADVKVEASGSVETDAASTSVEGSVNAEVNQ